MKIISCLIGVLMFAGFTISTDAQVTIPDPGLNAAVREALQKPIGPLTQADLLSLDFLSACCRDIKSLQGLEAAQNLRILDLHSNSLTNSAVINALTNLEIIDLFQNRLTSFTLTSARSNLTIIDLAFNSLTQCSLPNELTKLDTLFLEGNQLTNFSLPTGLSALTQLDLSANRLLSFAFPPDLTNLLTAAVFANQLTNVTVPGTLQRLVYLDLDFNRLPKLSLPPGLGHLSRLTVFGNQLTNLVLPPDMTGLGFLDLGDNGLTDLTLPFNLGKLSFLRVSGNKLSTLILPEGMTNLTAIFARSNQLTSLSLPSGLTQLVQIDVMASQLTNLTLRPDMTNLVTLVVAGNPLNTLVLSEPLAATNLAATVSILQNEGVSVFSYPMAAQLVRPLATEGAFKIGIKGPPGTYSVLGSTNLTAWAPVGMANNRLGSVNFTHANSNAFPKRFYRVALQSPPPNMVLIPSNTFTMGSPTNDFDRSIFEGPQATVTLTHDFWIGKYEVTQGEYLEVMGENPSNFPGDLSRPASSMSWFDATNYCAKLTQRERAAGRIAPGSKYRLPTEAEWECAARAGTTTQFSYGNDPQYTSLTNYAWFLDFQVLDLIVHPVGQKLPNGWGLYDMAGNVWEWCQDNYGQQTGGIQIDPTGPTAADANADKVIRGGAYDYPNSSCRSASRFFRTAFWPDSDVGFRVVLVTEP